MTENKKSIEEVLELWSKCRLDLEEMEEDLGKRLHRGNTSAGRRVRATIREIKKQLTELAKILVSMDKEVEDVNAHFEALEK